MTPRSRNTPSFRPQRGFTLIGLLFWGAVIAVSAVVAMKVFPTVVEYYTVKRLVNQIAAKNPSTVPAVRQEFDTAKQTQYGIESISGQDLSVSKDGGDKLVIEFGWDKEIELFGPVHLLIKYRGTSR